MIDFRVTAGSADSRVQTVGESEPVLIGHSVAVDRLRRGLRQAAAADTPLLITGEQGSGKSLAARAVHAQGPQAERLSAVVACDAIPESFLEGELFGRHARAGLLLREGRLLNNARGGTVILENLEASTEQTQTLLDCFLAEARGRARVIVTSSVPSVTATSRRHNSSLWARFGVMHLRVPTLRERPTDIPMLSDFFAAEGDSLGRVFSDDAMRALCTYPWPGNVTQLRSVVQRLLTSAKHKPIQPSDLPVGIRPRTHAGPLLPSRRSVGEVLFAQTQLTGESFWSAIYPLFMKREITRADVRVVVRLALCATRGDVNGLAYALNIPRSDQRRLLRFLRRYGCLPTSGSLGIRRVHQSRNLTKEVSLSGDYRRPSASSVSGVSTKRQPKR